ncbi:MAG: flagellin [Puniceicoccaceae bacterium]|nr:MAG: flagellin [Puniceicoccaceae bacterium]
MRITQNTFPDSLLNQLQRVTTKMNRLHEQTATGQRIKDLADDPTSVSRVLDMQAEKTRLSQFHRNAGRALDIATATVSELRHLLSISERAGEVAVLASDLHSPDGLMAYSAEINQLLEQALQSANREFSGGPLFAGTGGGPAFTPTRDADGRITSVAYTGSADQAAFKISDGTPISPFSEPLSNQRIAGFLNEVAALRDALAAGDTAVIASTVRQGLSESEDELIFALSNQGAVQMRIELETAQTRGRFTELERLISTEADVDIAQTIVQLTQVQNAYQASLQSAGKVLTSSLLDYLR